jgi:hypothetical protein
VLECHHTHDAKAGFRVQPVSMRQSPGIVGQLADVPRPALAPRTSERCSSTCVQMTSSMWPVLTS